MSIESRQGYELSHVITEAQPWPLASERSREYFERASEVIAGGVQGEGRSCRPHPLYMTRADGSRIWDVDGNAFVDFHSSFGAVLLGHNHPRVREAIERTLRDHGVTFATAHPLEVELAELVTECVPCAERVVFACTGSEVTYHAVRLARAATGRRLILKFEGNYHGWHDYVSWNTRFADGGAGPSSEPILVPDSAGIAPGMEHTVIVREYNDREGLRDAVERYGDELAAIIVEPVFHNAGVIEPAPGFLEDCRELATAAGSVLIFDEIITGFRHGLSGAQGMLGVTPDLSTFGKGVANGMPLSMLAGRRDLMEELAPLGPTFFSGTFCGHLLNVAAALACVRTLIEEPPYAQMEALGQRLRAGIETAIEQEGVRAQVRQLGSVWALYFADKAPRSYRELAAITSGKHDATQVAYQRWMAGNSIYLHPHSVLRGYITAAHTTDDIDAVVEHTAAFLHEHRSELAA
jgi:glutamate-1-semialdehyde 2,1-aminomutase